MTTYNDLKVLLEQLIRDVPMYVLNSKVTPKQLQITSGLSELTETLGLIRAGEFRAGNGAEPNDGFTGVRMGYPAFTYESSEWNIVGVLNDELQFGLNAANGKAYAGAGAVILDKNGISIIMGDNTNNAITWVDSTGDVSAPDFYINSNGIITQIMFSRKAATTELMIGASSTGTDGVHEIIRYSLIDMVTTPSQALMTLNTDILYINGRVLLQTAARVRKVHVAPLTGIGVGTTAPTLTRLGSSFGYAFTVGDDGYTTIEMPEDWDGASPLDVSMHIYTNETYASHSGRVRFQAVWTACAEGLNEVLDAPTHSGTLTGSDLPISTSAKGLQEYVIGSIPAASLSKDDHISFLISRIAQASGGSPTAEPVIIQVEVSYTANSLGDPA